MRLSRILAIVAFAGSFGVVFQPGNALAQIREQQPTEFPPSSYKGKQYVDSKGCVFIRAGIDGDVSWVPRVSRDRKTVCGFKPTNAGRAVAAVPAKAPVQITLDNAPAVAPAPRPVAQAAPRRTAQVPASKPRRVAPVVVRQTAPRLASAPKPRVVAAPQIITPAPQVRRTTVAQAPGACRGASAISSQYLRGEGVRCGPQTQPIVGYQTVRVAPRTTGVQAHSGARYANQGYDTGVTAATRVVPKHVAQRRLNTTNVRVPHGYKSVWEDDRLNPKRAEQTLGGRADMLLVWTRTLPRRLINQRTGRDVTASVPLVYPYTSVAQQRRELGAVTIVQKDGKLAKRILRNSGSKSVTRKPVYSSRSTPKAVAPQPSAPSKALVGKRYVQVGTFSNPANAQRAAQKIARMGMAARIGKSRRGGQTLMRVQAGPFHGANALQSAMNRLRNAGYRDAIAR